MWRTGFETRSQPIKKMRLGVMVTYSSPSLSEKQVADECIQFNSESRTMMAYSSMDKNTRMNSLMEKPLRSKE